MRPSIIVLLVACFEIMACGTITQVSGLCPEKVAGQHRFFGSPDTDELVVFVHGLCGTSDNTWTNRQSGFNFPRSLAQDYSAYVFAFDYATALDHAPSVLSVSKLLSFEIAQLLQRHSYKRVKFVAHSLGGLVVREYILDLQERDHPTIQVTHLVLLASPTNGSDLANFKMLVPANRQVAEMTHVDHGNSYLQSLNERWNKEFRAIGHPRSIFVAAAFEERSIFTGTKPVTYSSAVAEVDDSQGFHTDHFDIARPEGRGDTIYRWVIAKLKTDIDAPPNPRAGGVQIVNNFVSGVPISEYSDLEAKYKALKDKSDAVAKQAYQQGTQAFQEARTAVQRERYRSAISFLTIAANLLNVAEPHMYLASAHLAIGEASQAIDGFQRALELDPKLVDAWIGLGLAKEERRDYDGAIQAIEKAVALEPNSCRPNLHLAFAYYQANQFAEAESNYSEAGKGPACASQALVGLAQVEIAKAVLSGSTDEETAGKIIKYLYLAQKIDPSNPWAREILYAFAGVTSQDKPPADPEARKHFDRGEHFFAAGQNALALSEYSEAARLAPDSAVARAYVGDALFRLNRFEEAIQEYKKALDIDPKNFRAWRWIGDTLERLGRLDEAKGAYEKALEVNPHYVLAQSDLDRVSEKLRLQKE
jgi:tetratricopeptide (TPR) repeat protein/pimeloyl-ACP methyl ester carboxylesterase